MASVSNTVSSAVLLGGAWRLQLGSPLRIPSMRLSGVILAATAAVVAADFDWMKYYSTDPTVESFVQPGGITTDAVSGISCVTGSFQ